MALPIPVNERVGSLPVTNAVNAAFKAGDARAIEAFCKAVHDHAIQQRTMSCVVVSADSEFESDARLEDFADVSIHSHGNSTPLELSNTDRKQCRKQAQKYNQGSAVFAVEENTGRLEIAVRLNYINK